MSAEPSRFRTFFNQKEAAKKSPVHPPVKVSQAAASPSENQAAAPLSSSDVCLEIKTSVRAELLQEVETLQLLSDEELWERIRTTAIPALKSSSLSLPERKQLIGEIYYGLRGYDVVQKWMDDPRVTEIMINAHDKIFIEIGGRLYPTDTHFDSEEHLLRFIHHFFARANRPLSVTQPIADLRLEDGSRAHAVIPPASVDSAILNIRKFTGLRPDADALLENRSLSPEALLFLEKAVRERESIFISGGTGSGKTTLLNILSSFIPENERIISIEDSAELQLQNLPNLVRLEAQSGHPSGKGSRRLSISDLIRASLRMRPDRIIVGEVRGKEAVDLLDAMNTGHPGSLSTGHANSCLDMLNRLANLIQAHSDLPYENILRNLAAGIRIMVHLERSPDGQRYVREIRRLLSCSQGEFRTELCYSRDTLPPAQA